MSAEVKNEADPNLPQPLPDLLAAAYEILYKSVKERKLAEVANSLKIKN